jgi:hypothetical protein
MKRLSIPTGIRLIIEPVFSGAAYRGTLLDATVSETLGIILTKNEADVVESACNRLHGIGRGDDAAALMRHWNATK